MTLESKQAFCDHRGVVNLPIINTIWSYRNLHPTTKNEGHCQFLVYKLCCNVTNRIMQRNPYWCYTCEYVSKFRMKQIGKTVHINHKWTKTYDWHTWSVNSITHWWKNAWNIVLTRSIRLIGIRENRHKCTTILWSIQARFFGKFMLYMLTMG